MNVNKKCLKIIYNYYENKNKNKLDLSSSGIKKKIKLSKFKIIFVGKCTKLITNILQKIVKDRDISKKDINELNKFFKYDKSIEIIWGNLKDYDELIFSQESIIFNESIYNFLKILVEVINSELKNTEKIKKRNILLYGDFSKSVNKIIHNIKKKILKIYFNSNNQSLNKIIKKIYDEKIDEIEISTLDKLDKFLKNKNKFQIINFNSYKTVKNEIKFLYNYLNNIVINDKNEIDFEKIKSEDNLLKKNNDNISINNLGVFEDQTFYLYNIKNVKKYLDIDENFLKNFTVDKKEDLNLHKSYNEIVSDYSDYLSDKVNSENDVNFLENPKMINIKHSLVLPNNIELKDIFNNLSLNQNLPYVKYKDKSEQIVQKFYKPIFQKKQKKYRSIINRKVLDRWVNYSTMRFDNNEIVYKTTMTKILLYKLLFFKFNSNKKLKGKIYTYDLENNIYEIENRQIYTVNKENIINYEKIKNKLKPDLDVEFHDSNYIYGDIEIDESKNINIKINLEKLPKKYKLKEIINIIINKFNLFIENLLNLNFIIKFKKHLKDFNFIKTNFNDRNIYNDTYIKNYIFNLEYNYSHKKINYGFLDKLTEYLYPFIKTTLQPIFGEGKNGEFIEDNKDLRTNVIIQNNLGNKGYILNYDLINNRYKVKLLNGTVKYYSRNILKLENSNYNENYEIIFKKILGYKNLTPLKTVLFQIKNNDENINTRLFKNLENLDLESISQSIKKNDTIGISIIVRYLKQIELGDKKKVGLTIKYIDSLESYNNIKKFMNYFFNLYYNCSEKIDKCPKNFQLVLENKLKINQNLKDKDNKDKSFNENIFEDDLDDLDDLDDFDEETDWENFKLEENLEEYKDDNINNNLEEFLQNDQKITNKKNDNVWMKLKKMDPELFIMPKKSKYPRLCQGSKQPVVISKEIKNKIDSEYIGNLPYQIDKDTIDCHDQSSVEEAIKKDPYTNKVKGCHAILWGSTEENKNWYVCPKLYDSNLEKPINVEDLKFPDKKFKPKYKSIGENEKEVDNIIKNWNRDINNKNIMEFNPIDVNSEKGPIYISKPTKGEGSKFSFFPGFLTSKHKNIKGKMVPCCHTLKNGHVEDAFLKDKIDLNKSSYILGSKTMGELGNNRLGILPEYLHRDFNSDLNTVIYSNNKRVRSICNTGNGIIKNCYLRKGIKRNNNNFINLIAFYLTNEDKEIYTANNIINLVINNLTLKEFKNLNNGDLFLKFNTLGKQSSFQNYLEYLISREDKKYEYFYELLTKPNSYLFKNGVTLILLEYDPKTEKISILCPHFCNYKFNTNPEIPLFMAFKIKDESIFEPIVYCRDKNYCVKNLNNILDVKNVKKSKFFVDKMRSIYIHIIRRFNRCLSPEFNSKYNKHFSMLNNYNVFEKKSIISVYEEIERLNLNTEFILKDFYNKIIGIMIDKNKKLFIIPLYPQGRNLNCNANKCKIFNRNNMNYNNVNLVKIGEKKYKKDKLPTFEEYLDLFNFINDNSKLKLFPIKLIKESDDLVGFISNPGIFIPVKNEKFIFNDNYFENNFIKVDNLITEFRKVLDKKIYSEKNLIENIKKQNIKIHQKLKFIQEDVTLYFVTTVVELNKKEKIEIVLQINSLKIEDKDKSEYKNKKFLIEDLSKYIDACIVFNKITNFKFKIIPIYALFSNNQIDFKNKIYDRVVLETGLILFLKDKIPIFKKNQNNKFLISRILEEPIINKFFSDLKIIEDKIDSNESLQIQKITYVKKIFKQLLLNLGNFYRNNFSIRKLTKKITKNFFLNFNEKKELLGPLLNYIFNLITKKESFSTNYHNFKLGDSCFKNPIQNICYVNKKIINKKIKFKKTNNKIILNYIDEIEDSLKDLDKIKEYVQLIIIENEDNSRINIFKEQIMNSLISNIFQRNQILNNNFKEISYNIYDSNENEFMFFENDLIKEPKLIENYFNFYRKFYFNKYPLYSKISFEINNENLFNENYKKLNVEDKSSNIKLIHEGKVKIKFTNDTFKLDKIKLEKEYDKVNILYD